MKILIGVSGKRYIKPSEKDTVVLEFKKHIDAILKLYDAHEFTGVSALASGADSLFADLVLSEYKQPLIAILPFELNEYEKDFTNEDDLKAFKDQLSAASDIKVINKNKPSNQQQRTKFYFDAGKAIVDKTKHIIFVWDGLRPAGEGGTGDMIGYYATRYQINEQNIINVTPRDTDAIFNELESEYKKADERAIIARNNHTLVWKATLIFGCVAVIVFGINVGFNIKGGWELCCGIVELLLVAMALGLIKVAGKKKFHEDYLSQRILAEKLRLLKANYQMGNTVTISTITNSNDKKLSGLIKAINKSVLENNYRSAWFADYILKKMIIEQKKYHEDTIRKIGKKHKIGETINGGIGIALIVVIILHVLLNLYQYKYESSEFARETINECNLKHLFTFLSILLPVIYAAIEGWLFFENWEITQKFSRKIFENLNYCQKTLPVVLETTDFEVCRNVQNQSLQLLSNLMLTDNTNWLIILEDKANYHWVF